MRITSLGHAGLRLDGPELRLVMDPWLSGDGAFFGAWFPFPSNRHLSWTLLDCDWAAVSHEHQDHLDARTLAQLPAAATVLFPAYPSASMANRLARAGVGRLREVQAWERVALNGRGDWLTFIPETSPMCHDAAMLVVAADGAVLNCNDARLSAGQVRRAALEAGGRLDVMLIQTSGASWHPICYEYPREVVRRIEADKREAKLRAVARLVRAARPDLLVPSAGPPCFLDPDLARHNASIPAPGMFPDQAQAADWLTGALPDQVVHHLMPGDVLEVISGQIERDARWAGFDYANRAGLRDHLAAYAEDRTSAVAAAYAACPTPDHQLGPRLADHLACLGELSPWAADRVGMTVRFQVQGPGGGTWDASFGGGQVRLGAPGSLSAVGYRIRVDGRWLAPVLDGAAGWEDLFLSLRVRCWREPDIYNDYLVGLLKHADAVALAAVEAWEDDHNKARAGSCPTFVIQAPGGSYEVSRYCPHAGEDLTVAGVVAGGRVRCLGHLYEFDLATGACLNARCKPLLSRPVAVPAERACGPGGVAIASA